MFRLLFDFETRKNLFWVGKCLPGQTFKVNSSASGDRSRCPRPPSLGQHLVVQNPPWIQDLTNPRDTPGGGGGGLVMIDGYKVEQELKSY